jgi:hypothetical protein
MPIQNETPKARFLKSKERIEAHRFIISHPQFDNSIDTALLEYQSELSRGGDVNNAGARHFQMAGALAFVSHLKNLSEIVEPVRAPTGPQLRHDA